MAHFFIADNIAIILLALALWYFWQQLILYKRSLYFSAEAITDLKKIVRCLLGWAVYKLLFPALTTIIISCFRISGKGRILAMVGSNDVIRFFVVLIVSVIVYVMQEAYRIKSEQDLVV